MRLLAIGDIHGYRDKLERLMDQVCPTGEDQVVFLGDYVDRGPDSKGVLDVLIAFGERFPKTVFLQGNHEQMMLDYLHRQHPLPGRIPLAERSLRYAWENRHDGPGIWLHNGGRQCLESYPERKPAAAHIDFLLKTRLFFEFDKYLFVHASVAPDWPLAEQDPFDLLWERGPLGPCVGPLAGKVVVNGHTPRDEPFFGEHRVELDTGSTRGPAYPLTCADLLSGRIWQATCAPEPEATEPWRSTQSGPPEEAMSVLLSDGINEVDAWYRQGFFIGGECADLAVYTRWRKRTRW